MSKHFKNLKKINKRQLGLKSSDFDTEIEALGTRRDSLAGLIFEQKQLVEGAEILYDTVEEYHLKSTVDDNKAVNSVVANSLDSDTAISTISSLVVSFFTSSISNNTNFISNATTYADKTLDLYVDELLTSGKLTITTTSSGDGSTGTFSISGGGTEEGGSVVGVSVGETALLTSVIEYAESLEATANEVVANINAKPANISLGISAEVLTVDKSVTIQLNFSNSDFDEQAIQVSTFGDVSGTDGVVAAGEIVTVISKETKQAFNSVVTDYISTYEKLFKEYLPSFMVYDNTLTKLINNFKLFTKADSELLEKSNTLLTTFTNFNTLTKEQKITLTEGFRKSISNAVIELKKEVNTSNSILENYGLTNLNKQKSVLESLEKENDAIDSSILELENEKTAVSNIIKTKNELKTEIEESLSGIDTLFITGSSLVSIISASSAHTETLKVFAGNRLNDLIKTAASKGQFQVEVEELTNIEAKILLDNGYEIVESFDRKKFGNLVKNVVTFTIRWANANSEPEE